jgi:hypothetical protein
MMAEAEALADIPAEDSPRWSSAARAVSELLGTLRVPIWSFVDGSQLRKP